MTRLHPRRGSWRVALRYAARDGRRHKGRTALVAIMVALPVGLGAAGAVLVTSGSTYTPAWRIAQELGTDAAVQASIEFEGPGSADQNPSRTQFGTGSSFDSDLFRTKQGGKAKDSEHTVPVAASAYAAALTATVPSGDRLEPVLMLGGATVAPAGASGLHAGVTAYQLDTSTAARSAYGLKESAVFAGQVAVSKSVAHDLGVHVGDKVTVSLPDGTPEVAVYDGDGGYTNESGGSTTPAGTYTVGSIADQSISSVIFGSDGPIEAPTSYDFWRDDVTDSSATPDVTWLVVGQAPETWSDVQAANQIGAVVFSRSVVANPPPAAVAAYEARYPGDSSSSGTDESDVAVVAGAAVLGLLQAILMIGPAFQVGARRAARDLALLAAAGADGRTLRRTVLAGGLVIGTIASVGATIIGATAAYVGVRTLSTMVAVMPWPWLIAFAAIGMFIAVGAAWLPARRAARTDSARVLAGRRADAPAKRWPAVVGTALAVAGSVVALVGAATGQSVVLLTAGIVVAEIGLVIASGAIVGAVARLARVLHGTARLALRDAARHRARTAPAVAAVLAATTAAVAGLALAGAQAQYDQLSYTPGAATNTLMVGPLGQPRKTIDSSERATLTRVVDAAGVLDGPMLPVDAVRPKPEGTWITVFPFGSNAGAESSNSQAFGTIVDDGTSLRRLELLGVPDPKAAATALRAGRLVVLPSELAPNGTASISVGKKDLTVPASSVGGGIRAINLPLIPPSMARGLGLTTGTAGLVGHVRSGSWNAAVSDTLNGRLQAALPAPKPAGGEMLIATASAYVEPGHATWGTDYMLVDSLIVGGCLIVALAAAWIATALAGTESLPDLATLRAVGAPPRTRRRFAAAQSAVITVTGVVLGTGMGLVLGCAIVLMQREAGGSPDPRWMIDVPWAWVAGLAVVLPVLGAAASWVVTRSRLPMTRRLDG